MCVCGICCSCYLNTQAIYRCISSFRNSFANTRNGDRLTAVFIVNMFTLLCGSVRPIRLTDPQNVCC